MESNPAKKISVVVILVGLFLCLNMAAFPGDADVPKGGAVSNDNCENAIPVSVDEEVRGTTIGATGDPQIGCGWEDFADVWHMFTPESDGIYLISLCGSDFDTTLSVFTGGCAVLEEIGCNDDGGSCSSEYWGASELAVELTENIPYLIRIAGNSGATGNYVLQIIEIERPGNDNCENAMPVSVDEEVRGTTNGATGSMESSCSWNDYADVWHMFTPESDGIYLISLCGSSFNTTLSVFTGGCAVLEEIGCNDNGGSCSSEYWGASELVVELTENIPYLIRIAGNFRATGNYVLQITEIERLSNDNCENAIPVSVDEEVRGTTIGATGSMKSSCSWNDYADVWHMFTPESDGIYLISLCGSNFNTTLSVFTGGCAVLEEISCSTDGRCSSEYWGASELVVELTENIPYLIRIAGDSGATGNYVLQITEIERLSNDNCENAIPVSVDEEVRGTTIGATGDLKSDCGWEDYADVWHMFTPESDGIYLISLCGSDFDTTLSVFTGGCAVLEEIGCSNEGRCSSGHLGASELVIELTENIPYLIRIAGNSRVTGNYVLQITEIERLSNDNCENAIPVSVDEEVRGTTIGATGDPQIGCGWADFADVWHMFTPESDGIYLISLCGSDFDTTLSVFTGGCAVLEKIGCNNNGGSCGSGHWGASKLVVELTENIPYLIRIAGDSRAIGNYVLQIIEIERPGNDNCENAIPLSVDEEVRGTTIGATGDLESDCGGEDYADVWHMFTPESDGVYKISLCGSDFDTTLSVFTGSCAVLEEIGCNDDGGSCGSGHWGASELVVELTENIPYLIRIAGHNSAMGTYELKITEESGSVEGEEPCEGEEPAEGEVIENAHPDDENGDGVITEQEAADALSRWQNEGGSMSLALRAYYIHLSGGKYWYDSSAFGSECWRPMTE